MIKKIIIKIFNEFELFNYINFLSDLINTKIKIKGE